MYRIFITTTTIVKWPEVIWSQTYWVYWRVREVLKHWNKSHPTMCVIVVEFVNRIVQPPIFFPPQRGIQTIQLHSQIRSIFVKTSVHGRKCSKKCYHRLSKIRAFSIPLKLTSARAEETQVQSSDRVQIWALTEPWKNPRSKAYERGFWKGWICYQKDPTYTRHQKARKVLSIFQKKIE